MDHRSTSKAYPLWISLVVGGLLLGVFVWPTLWRTAVIGGNTWRFSRIGSCSEVRTLAGWVPAGPNRCDGATVSGESPATPPMVQDAPAAQPSYTNPFKPDATSAPVADAVVPQVWTMDATDSEVGAAIRKLSARMKLNRAWTAMQDGAPTFFVDIQNDSACTVNTVVLTVSDPVYGEMPGITLDAAPDSDTLSDPVILSGGHTQGSMVSVKVVDLPAEEVPVSRLNVEWTLVLPVMGEPRGCEDRSATDGA